MDVPQKVKDRAELIRLNAHRWYVEKIAAHFNWTAQTVREVLHLTFRTLNCHNRLLRKLIHKKGVKNYL